MNRLMSYLREHERLMGALTLLGGFLFDAYFFRRIDLPFENAAIILHFVVGFIAIILLHLATTRFASYRFAQRLAPVFPPVIQLAIGGLFGKFFIFFYRSGSVVTSWPVLLILFAMIIANESARERYAQLNFNLAIFYTALLLYCIMVAPIVLASISTSSFLLGELASFFIIFCIIRLINYFSRDINPFEQRRLSYAIGGVAAAVTVMYFANILPPMPLALKDAGVYHDITRVAPGVYEASAEKDTSWFPFDTDVFHKSGTDSVYVFAAVFAPANLATTVVHVWQWKNEQGKWVIEQRIPLDIVGGRDGGYRGYSVRSGAEAGDWRVDVETPRGQLLGRIDFKVEEASTTPALQTVSL